MIECYYKWCPYHDKDEPFCKADRCQASAKDLKGYEEKLISERGLTRGTMSAAAFGVTGSLND